MRYLMVLLFPLFVLAAPAPRPKQEKPITKDEVTGKYVINWQGHVKYYANLLPDGEYRSVATDEPQHTGADQIWVGTWDFKGDELIIREGLWNRDKIYFTYPTVNSFNENKIKIRRAAKKSGYVFVGKDNSFTFAPWR